jgi:mannose-6-phosphate isomerase-like protein (cupin superfamily)
VAGNTPAIAIIIAGGRLAVRRQCDFDRKTAGWRGPGLHRHPYSETCIVFAGQAEMVVDGKVVVAAARDIVVIGPETPHRFAAIGDERLDMVCVHASDRFIIEWLNK